MEKLLAQGTPTPAVRIDISVPTEGINPQTPFGIIINNIFTIVFIIAALAVLFMLILGAFQWITSGGDKEAVGKARSRITHALIGLAVLALAFFIIQIVGSILGVPVVETIRKGLPSLQTGFTPTPT